MIRFSTWSAVSTESQAAPDKVSLDVQLQHCTNTGTSKGWIHVTDYIVSGQSRTRFVNLRDAEAAIPALRQMLDNAKNGLFDVLVLYDFDRLRDLLDPVARVLTDYGIQLYSLAQPVEPQSPETFDPYSAETSQMMQSFSGMISRAEINNLRRHYRDKMPRRITDKGLHAGIGLPPYGYHKPLGKELDRNAVLIQDSAQVRILVQIKDWFLAGVSLTQIAQRLNDQRIPSPRGRQWWYSIVGYLLANSYYAGYVSFGATRRHRIRREGTVQRIHSKPVTAHGKHIPIWDDATHQRIISELQRRGQAHSGIQPRQLSRLLYCGICGSVMWAQSHTYGNRWRCSSLTKGHITILDDLAIKLVTQAVINAIRNLDTLQLPTPEDKRPSIQSELDDLNRRKKRWMDVYETGGIELTDLTERLSEITNRIEETEKRLSKIEHSLTQGITTRKTLQALSVSVETLPGYYLNGNKVQVNTDLHTILARVIVQPDKTVELVWL